MDNLTTVDSLVEPLLLAIQRHGGRATGEDLRRALTGRFDPAVDDYILGRDQPAEGEQRENAANDLDDPLLVQHPHVVGANQRITTGRLNDSGKLAGIDRSGIGETFCPYLLQLASSTNQDTSSSKLCPA